MNYISHVLHYPGAKPFDQPDTRWPAFIGEFVAPIVSQHPTLIFWFTHYGNHAKFRLYTDDYDSIRGTLEARRDELALTDKGEEKDLTLVGDLGHGRFISPNGTSTPERRAKLILHSLCATARLVIDSVVKDPNGYWAFEENMDANQNPDKCHLFSVTHLFHNMCASDAFVYLFQHGGMPQVLSYYYFCSAANAKQINPAGHQRFRIQL